MRKPDPEIYALTLERLALPAEACLFLDDIDVNVDDGAGARDERDPLPRTPTQAIAEIEAALDR